MSLDDEITQPTKATLPAAIYNGAALLRDAIDKQIRLAEDGNKAALRKLADVPRVLAHLEMAGEICVATPCIPGLSTTQETFNAVARGFAFERGLAPLSVQSFEVANNREFLMDRAIQMGYRKLLFLDADTLVDWNGVEQMLSTMARWRCAMVAGLVLQRYLGEGDKGKFNAFLKDDDGNSRALVRDDIPESLTAFNVNRVGLAVALIDLEMTKNKPGPRFKRVAEGLKHYGEDISYCDWLTANGFDYVVDPKVQTVHCVFHRFGYSPPTQPAAP